MTLTVKTLVNDRHHIELLKAAYNQILVPAFPLKDQLDSVERMVSLLQGRVPNVRMVAIIMGEHLEDPARRTIKGIGIAHYYERQNVGLLAYNAVDPACREGGYGKLLVNARIEALQKLARRRGRPLAGAFIEVNDPARVTAAEDTIDPARRVAIFEKLGARAIPLPYRQPPTEAGGGYCDTLMLMNYPIHGAYADAKTIGGMIDGIYGEAKALGTAAHTQMHRDLAALIHAPESLADAPGYARNLPDHVVKSGLSPAERIGYLTRDFKLLLSRRGTKSARPRR